MAFNNPILGGDFLVRPQMESPNFVTGVSGWIIRKDGSVEFNNGTFRGVLDIGTNPGAHIDIGTNDAILIYNSSNALVISIAPTAGTDGFGNTYPAGLSVGSNTASHILLDGTGEIMTGYDATDTRNYQLDPTNSVMSVWDNAIFNIMQINGNTLLWTSVTSAGALPNGTQVANAATVSGSPSLLALSSGNGGFAVNADPVQMGLNSGQTGSGTGAASVPFLSLLDGLNTAVIDGRISGSWVKTDLFGVPATWHNATMGTGWAQGSGIGGSYPNLRYRLDAENNVHINGVFHATSTTPSTPIATGLPAVSGSNVMPIGSVPCVNLANREFAAYLNPSGQISANTLGTFAVNDTFMINAVVPLNNLP